MISCDSIRSSFSQYLAAETEVLSTKRACILSLPIKVIDGANIEAFIEQISDDSFLVHDAGKTVGRLESSGLILTDGRMSLFGDLAKRFGVAFDEGVFKTIARSGTLNGAAMSVGQCCSMALFELLSHTPSSDEERIRARVDNEVNAWSESTGIPVIKDYKVSGSVQQYKFDYLVEASTPVALSLLIPTYGAKVSADRYALQVLDIRSADHSRRKLLAALARPEKWNPKTRRVISKLADEVAEVSATESLYPTGVSDALNRLAIAA